MLIINIMLNGIHQKGAALIYLLNRFVKNKINMPSLFEVIENRLHPEKLDIQVKKAIIESSKKNWVERNPIKAILINSLISAIMGSGITLLIQSLL